MNTQMNNIDKFGWEHYTYINQIFGDSTVREIIKESYAKKEWNFRVEEADANFEFSNHHVLIKKNKKGEEIKWCSVDEKIQNIFINKKDNLCQTYTLMKYLNKPIHKNMKKRQKEMIRMYRNIIGKDNFKRELKDIINIMNKKIVKLKRKNNKSVWKNYTNSENEYLNIDIDTLYLKIHEVLNKWEKYGYWYFIKDGDYPL